MRGLFSILALFLAFAALPVFGNPHHETIRVQINHEKKASRSQLRVRFTELVEDSRCPTDVDCVWAGNAKIKVRVSKNGRSHDLTLDTNGPNQTVTVEGYSIRLVGLTPEPRSNIRIDRNGYVAVIEVARAKK